MDWNKNRMEHPINYHPIIPEKVNTSLWVKIKRWDKILLLLVALTVFAALIALFILSIPVINLFLRFLGLQIDGWLNFSDWISQGDRALSIFLIAALSSLVFALIARFWLKRNRAFYIQSGCPQCREHELIRVRRWRGDRLLGSLGVPVRRYACRNCTWQGLRLSDKKPKRSRQVVDTRARKDLDNENVAELDSQSQVLEAYEAEELVLPDAPSALSTAEHEDSFPEAIVQETELVPGATLAEAEISPEPELSTVELVEISSVPELQYDDDSPEASAHETELVHGASFAAAEMSSEPELSKVELVENSSMPEALVEPELDQTVYEHDSLIEDSSDDYQENVVTRIESENVFGDFAEQFPTFLPEPLGEDLVQEEYLENDVVQQLGADEPAADMMTLDDQEMEGSEETMEGDPDFEKLCIDIILQERSTG